MPITVVFLLLTTRDAGLRKNCQVTFRRIPKGIFATLSSYDETVPQKFPKKSTHEKYRHALSNQ